MPDQDGFEQTMPLTKQQIANAKEELRAWATAEGANPETIRFITDESYGFIVAVAVEAKRR